MINNNQKLNVMQICLSPNKGGLELYVTKLSKFLNSQANVVAVINKNGDLSAYIQKQNITSYAVKTGFLNLFSNIIKITKLVNQHQIKTMHAHWTKDLLVAVMVKILANNTPKLVQTRHMSITTSKNDFYHVWLYKHIDLMIAVTQQVQQQIARFIPQKCNVQAQLSYIGTESTPSITPSQRAVLEQKYGINNEFCIGIVGRIEHQKGQYLLIDALAKLIAQDVSAKLLIVGSAMNEQYLTHLKNHINKLGLSNHIIFTGFIDNSHQLMQLFDVLVLATDNETFGMVLVEAMHAGVCVIASNNGGSLEIIEDGKTGLLFTSGDSINLSVKIKALYTDKAFRKSLALAGKKHALVKFNAKQQFQEVLLLLSKI